MTYLIKDGYWKALKMFILPLSACMHVHICWYACKYVCRCCVWHVHVCMHAFACVHACVCRCVCGGYACAHVCDIISENKCMYAHVHELIIYKFICKDIIQCKKYACFEMRQITQCNKYDCVVSRQINQTM